MQELPKVMDQPIAQAQSHLRLAIVGCGAISEQAHIPAAIRVDEVRLVALVDTDLSHAKTLAARFNIPMAVSALDECWNEIDAVILATPPHVRSKLALQSFQKGLHVLCEKPMANTSAECKEMIASARLAKRTLGVAHTYRFFPNRAYARTLYKSGRLGRMISVHIEQGDPFGWPTRTLYTLRQNMVPGGVLFNEGIHAMDLLEWWFGSPVSFDYQDDSLGGLESNVRLTLKYKDGGIAHFRLSRTCSLRNEVTMQFEKGALAFPLYEMAGLTLESNGQSKKLVVHTTPWDYVEIVARQLQDFAFAAIQGHPVGIPGEEGAIVIEMIESCYKKAAQRVRPARTPLPGVTW
jgi:predicted dehydrogenase